MPTWKEVYRGVVGEVLNDAIQTGMAATGCCSKTARNWAEGRALMTAAKWKAIVVYCECELRWRALSEARDAEQARKGKRGRKPVGEAEQLRRRAAKLTAKADNLEAICESGGDL